MSGKPNGGGFNPKNLSLFSYTYNNPVNFVDPDGNAAGDSFDSLDDAAIDWGKTYNDDSIRNKVEYSSLLYSFKNEDGGISYSYNLPKKGELRHTSVNMKLEVGQKQITNVHAHGNWRSSFDFRKKAKGTFGAGKDWNNIPSPKTRKYGGKGDRYMEYSNNGEAYVTTPNGALTKFGADPSNDEYISFDMPSDKNDKSRLNNLDASNMQIYKEDPIYKEDNGL